MKDAGKSARLFPYFAFAAGMFLGWAGWSTPSFGQASEVTTPAISPPPPAEVTPDNVPADTELGIPLGSFRLYPTLDVRAGYDTNVFASSAGQQTGSAYEAIRPSLDVRSDWNNHMLNFGGYGAFGFFNSATSQNYQNFGFNTDGRLDIYRDWNVTASAAFTGTTELLGTPDVAQTQSPSVVYAVPINLGMFQRFSRLFYQVNAGYTALRYSDFSQLNTNALPAGSRDRNQFTESLRAGYELREGFDVWLQGGLNQRSYLQQVTASKHRRPTTRFQRLVGRGRIDARVERRQQARSFRRLYAGELFQSGHRHRRRHVWPGRHLERLSAPGGTAFRHSIHQ